MEYAINIKRGIFLATLVKRAGALGYPMVL